MCRDGGDAPKTPAEIAGFRNPFHVVAIPNMGLPLGETFFLEELAADCAADGRYVRSAARSRRRPACQAVTHARSRRQIREGRGRRRPSEDD